MNERDSMSRTAKRFLFNDGSSPTDYRADLFTTVMTSSRPVNAGNLKNTALWDIMNVDQYTTRDSRMRSGDVHNQFIDFLVKTAAWHNLIDKPRDFGKNLDKLNILIGNYIDHFSNTNISVNENFAVYPNVWNNWADVRQDVTHDDSWLSLLVGNHTVINFFQKYLLEFVASLMMQGMEKVDEGLRNLYNFQTRGGMYKQPSQLSKPLVDIANTLLQNFPSLRSNDLAEHLKKVNVTNDDKIQLIQNSVANILSPPVAPPVTATTTATTTSTTAQVQKKKKTLKQVHKRFQPLSEKELQNMRKKLKKVNIPLQGGGRYMDLNDTSLITRIINIIEKAKKLVTDLDSNAFEKKPNMGFDYTQSDEYLKALDKPYSQTKPELIASLADNVHHGGYNERDTGLANAILQGKLLGQEETHLSMYVLEHVRKNLAHKDDTDEFYDAIVNSLNNSINSTLKSLENTFARRYVNRFQSAATSEQFVKFLYETVVNPGAVLENNMKTFGNELHRNILSGLKSFLENNVNGTHNTLKDENQKLFWDNTFAKWGDLTPEVQSYLERYVHLLKRDSNDQWSEVDPLSHRNISESDRVKYRVNFKQGTYPYNQFASDLPDLSGFSGAMWYTNSTGNLAQLPHKNLRKLYHEIYSDATGQSISHPGFERLSSSPIGVTHFYLNYKSFIRKKMERARYYRRTTDDSDADVDKDKVKYSSRMWSRDNKGLRRKDIEGNWEYVDELHHKYGACSLLGIDEKDEQLCNKTIIDCLRSNNPNDLALCRKQFMNSPNWFKNVQEQIRNIHPEFAVDILHSFGFRTNPDERGIYVIESAHEWKRNLRDNDKLDHQEVEILSSGQNELFFNYLNHLSEWVNSNPAILNESYRGTSVRDRGLTKFAKQHNLTMRPDLVSLRRNMSAREKLRNVIYLFGRQRYDPNRTYTVSLSSGTPLGRGFSVSLGEDPLGMQEGGSVYPMRVSDTLNELMAEHNEGVGGGILKRLVQSVISELETEGRSLDPSDKQKLLRIADHIIELEGELVESINYIDKFNTLRYRIGHTPDAGKVLNYSRLQALVKRHSGLVNRRAKYEDRLAKAFQTLVDYLDS